MTLFTIRTIQVSDPNNAPVVTLPVRVTPEMAHEWAVRKFCSCVCHSCLVITSAFGGAVMAAAASSSRSTTAIAAGAAGGAGLSLLCIALYHKATRCRPR